MRRAGSVVTLCVLTSAFGVCARPAEARPAPTTAATAMSAPRGHAALSLPPFLKNIGRRWAQKPPKKVALRFTKFVIKRSAKEWIKSGGTECQFPFPERFCTQRAREGLGQAVSYRGAPPGVWSRTVSPRHEISAPLVVGSVYYLNCWLLGERIYGPYGSTDLWYRLRNGGYVSDALLYTGTNDVISGVAHC